MACHPASMLLRQHGVRLQVVRMVMELVGHTQRSQTVETYLHALPGLAAGVPCHRCLCGCHMAMHVVVAWYLALGSFASEE